MELKTLPLNIIDLVPKESKLRLERVPVDLTLRHWSLLVKEWAKKRFGGPENLQLIFAEQRIVEIAELCFFMLKDESKKHFEDATGTPSLDKFLDSIASVKDQIAIQKALLATIGIGEPEFEQLEKSLPQGATESADPKPQSPKKIGAKSSTTSQAGTRGARRKGSST
jgi:hypothetical protein